MIRPGVKYFLLATVFFTIMNTCIKFIPRIPAHEIIFFRSIITFCVTFFQLKSLKISPWGNNKTVLILRGIFGLIALTSFFTTLQIMPLASAITIHQLAPIFTILFAVFIVNEKAKPLQFLFFSLSFVGVVFIYGFDNRISIKGLLLGISGAVFSGLAYNMVRKSRNTEHPLVVVMYFPLVALPIITIWCMIDWVTPIGWEWLLLIIVGLSTQIAQVFLTKAYQLEKASSVSIWQYLGLIYSLIIGYVIFDESYLFWSYIGMILIILGIVLNFFYEKYLINASKM